MGLVFAASVPAVLRSQASTNANGVAEKMARIITAEQTYSFYLNGFLPLILKLSCVAVVLLKPELAFLTDAQLTSPGYAITLTLDNANGAPTGPACTSGSVGSSHFTIAATPILPNCGIVADSNVNAEQSSFTTARPLCGSPYVIAASIPYQL